MCDSCQKKANYRDNSRNMTSYYSNRQITKGRLERDQNTARKMQENTSYPLAHLCVRSLTVSEAGHSHHTNTTS